MKIQTMLDGHGCTRPRADFVVSISMPSPALEQVISMLRSRRRSPDEPVDIPRMRVELETMAAALTSPSGVTVTPVTAGSVPSILVEPEVGAGEHRLMYLHGGGYVIGSVQSHLDVVARLACACGARVLSLDYRLAPEHPFPAAVDDAVAAYRWWVGNGADPRQTVVAGDSAGGGLTVATLVALRDGGDRLPAAGVCFSPWVDLEGLGESMIRNAATDPNIELRDILFVASLYLAGGDPRAPLAAPLYADLRGLPPLLILASAVETLLDDSVRLAGRARQAGVDVQLEVWDDMVHAWPVLAALLPEGQQAIERVAGFVHEVVGRPSGQAPRLRFPSVFRSAARYPARQRGWAAALIARRLSQRLARGRAR
jgi:phosphinothricin tripeptide acetyl hydrolase